MLSRDAGEIEQEDGEKGIERDEPGQEDDGARRVQVSGAEGVQETVVADFAHVEGNAATED